MLPTIKKRPKRHYFVRLQCFCVGVLSLLVALWLVHTGMDMYEDQRARGAAFHKVWLQDQRFYESLGYHPPFGTGISWPVVLTFLAAAIAILLAWLLIWTTFHTQEER